MARWQDEESPKQWEQWQYFALRIAIARNIRGTYDAADYAANAIEKLLSQTKKPENVKTEKPNPSIIGRHPWLMVILAFLVLLGAWSALITIAVKHAPQSIEFGQR